MNEAEDRMSILKEEQDLNELSKNMKSFKKHKEDIQEMQDTMKSLNLQIIGIDGAKELQVNGTDKIFKKIIEEYFFQLICTHTDTKNT